MIFLWAFIGPIGIAAYATFIVVNLAIATRVMRHRTYDLAWLSALLSFTMIIRWSVYVYSDLGLIEVRSLALLGLFLGTVWRLAPHRFAYGEHNL